MKGFFTIVFLSLSLSFTFGRPSVALVLAGGGAKGFAHIPILELIDELQIPIDMVIGNSAGAIVGALYSAGYSPKEIEEELIHLDWSTVFSDSQYSPFEQSLDSHSVLSTPLAIGLSTDFSLQMGTGLLSGQKAYELLKEKTLKYPSYLNFDDLPIAFRAVSVDLFTGELVVLSEGDIAEAVRASISIPGFFNPFEIDGQYYVDGLVRNNFPIDIAKEMGFDIIIAVEIMPPLEQNYSEFESNPFVVLNQWMNVGQAVQNKQNYKLADVLIVQDTSKFSAMDYSRATEILEESRKNIDLFRTELLKIREKTGVRNPESHYVYSEKKDPSASYLQIYGALESDEKFIKKDFEKIKDKGLTTEIMKDFLNSIHTTNNYKKVVTRLLENPDKTFTLELRLTPREEKKGLLLLGAEYHGTVAQDSSNTFTISGDLQFRGLTGLGSVLSLRFVAIDNFKAQLMYLQPFTSHSFLRFSTDYLVEEKVVATGWRFFPITSSRIDQWNTDLTIGFPFSNGHTLTAGAGIHWFNTISSFSSEGSKSFTGDFNVQYFFSNFDHKTFPKKGFYLSIKGLGILPITDTKTVPITEVLTVDTTAVIPLGSKVSLVWNGFLGMNLSEGIKFLPSLQPIYGFSLADRRFFPQICFSPTTGQHKFVLGGAIQCSPWRQLTILGGEAFFSISGAVGNIWEDYNHITLKDLVWRASFDTGIRIYEDLGVALRIGAGVTRGVVRPFVSLDLGSIRL